MGKLDGISGLLAGLLSSAGMPEPPKGDSLKDAKKFMYKIARARTEKPEKKKQLFKYGELVYIKGEKFRSKEDRKNEAANVTEYMTYFDGTISQIDRVRSVVKGNAYGLYGDPLPHFWPEDKLVRVEIGKPLKDGMPDEVIIGNVRYRRS